MADRDLVSSTGSSAPAPPAPPGSAPSGGRRGSGPQPYDFRRPNKFNRDHIRALQIVSETFARQLTTVIATTLRAVSTVTLAAVEQLTYDEYVRGVPNPSYLAILALDPLPGAAMLQIPLTIATAAIDRMLGGRGDTLDNLRPLTEIEESLMRTLTERALRELAYAFESLVKLEPRIMAQESNAQFAQITTPSDMTLTIQLDMKIAEARDRATLCIPYDTLAPVLDTLAGESLFAGRGGNAAMFATNLHDALEDVPDRRQRALQPGHAHVGRDPRSGDRRRGPAAPPRERTARRHDRRDRRLPRDDGPQRQAARVSHREHGRTVRTIEDMRTGRELP